MTRLTKWRWRWSGAVVAVAAAVALVGAAVVALPTAAGASGPAALYAWGINGSGQLGNGSTGNTWVTTPGVVSRFTGNIVQGAEGLDFSLALQADGTVWAWGANDFGVFGTTTPTISATPVQVPGLTGIVAIAAGDGFGLALDSGGFVWAWGANDSGQIGNGTDGNEVVTPVKLTVLGGTVAQIAAGSRHSLAMRANGEVWGWGDDSVGQIGDGAKGDNANQHQVTPIRTGAPYGIVQIAAAQNHSLAIRSVPLGGSVWTWGDNADGDLGDNTTTERATPVLVLRNATGVGAGATSSYAIGSDGSAFAWGGNGCGQLGDGTRTEHHTPEQLAFTGVSRITGGSLLAGAIRTDGTVWTWGINGGSCATPDLSPVQKAGLTTATSLSIGAAPSVLVVADAPAVQPPTQVSVPNLIDDTCAFAQSQLQAIGLVGSCDGTGNFVGNQSPGEGTLVDPGTVIALTMVTSAP